MSVTIKGDHGFDNKPSIEAKALRINLNPSFTELLQKLVQAKKLPDIFLKLEVLLELLLKRLVHTNKNFSDTIYGERS